MGNVVLMASLVPGEVAVYFSKNNISHDAFELNSYQLMGSFVLGVGAPPQLDGECQLVPAVEKKVVASCKFLNPTHPLRENPI